MDGSREPRIEEGQRRHVVAVWTPVAVELPGAAIPVGIGRVGHRRVTADVQQFPGRRLARVLVQARRRPGVLQGHEAEEQ